ncbi:uncharacterized protein H6S33_005887 [Morchella sextelata]|uniref:uncharacterized protein n=1 Tax=Morchella sextelata TaxID=1174677 RepID=UPI001D056B6E|nr:uncharacterized protein H6S33_005887 [Morchella sextelata]KAH0614001.1 hypothetical protein H6S33_005887 [Morchella sextelata]
MQTSVQGGVLESVLPRCFRNSVGDFTWEILSPTIPIRVVLFNSLDRFNHGACKAALAAAAAAAGPDAHTFMQRQDFNMGIGCHGESSTRVGDYSPGVAPSLVSRSRLFNKELTKRNETGVVLRRGPNLTLEPWPLALLRLAGGHE